MKGALRHSMFQPAAWHVGPSDYVSRLQSGGRYLSGNCEYSTASLVELAKNTKPTMH